MLSHFKEASSSLWARFKPTLANTPNQAETQSLLEDIGQTQIPSERAAEIKAVELRAIPLSKASLKLSWIEATLKSWRHKSAASKCQTNYYAAELQPTRPHAVLDIMPQTDDPNHYLTYALMPDHSRTDMHPTTRSNCARHDAPAKYLISLNTATPVVADNYFSRQTIGYTVMHPSDSQSDHVEVIGYQHRPRDTSLNSEDLRTLHDAMSVLTRQNKRFKVYSHTLPRDVATLNAYHRLRENIVDHAKRNKEVMTVMTLLAAVENHIAYRKSCIAEEKFDTLEQYTLVLNTLYQDLLQANAIES